MAEQRAGNVIPFNTYQDRARVVAAYLHKQEPLLKIRTVREALSYGDAWREYAMRMEDEYQWQLLMLKTDLTIEGAQRLIERIALQDEIKRLRGLIT